MPAFRSKPVLLAAASIAASLALARLWQRRSLEAVLESVRSPACSSALEPVDDAGFDSLPPPVARYLNHVLPPARRGIRLARYEQLGTLRTNPRDERWMRFSASQLIAAAPPAFVWDARVAVLPPLIQLRVRDSCVAGVGAGQVALLSAVPVAAAQGGPEMNSGALHRFLAEAVWCPSALLPGPKLRWQPIDETRALATLSEGGATVSLEFRFGPRNEVTAVHTPGRWGSFDGGYRQLAWEGRFHDYAEHDGVRVPTEAEAGWYLDGAWRAVWRGRITRAYFE